MLENGIGCWNNFEVLILDINCQDAENNKGDCCWLLIWKFDLLQILHNYNSISRLNDEKYDYMIKTSHEIKN